ncbi:MAG: ribonuclease P protein component [Actinomycetaceae bacterium]|nr:ribonuclease P protein component [Actinomycetaceae bacterium]MDY6082439.1 ribonuclease P protein component [Actinomycetaceae bacterium]
MLAAQNRMRRSEDFVRAFHGVKGTSSRVLVFLRRADVDHQADLTDVKVGFVVPKSVGNSVVRHTVSRKLRHIMRARLHEFHPGDLVVVRALPPSADASSEDLARDIDAACLKISRRMAKRDAHA